MVSAAPFRIAGYLPDYRAATFDVEATGGLTDLFLFSAEPTATGRLEFSRLDPFPWNVLRDLQERAGVRLILCVGGWGRSEHFAVVARSEALREEFTRAAVAFCRERGLNGLDLDWEHPASAAEEEAYADLLADLRRAFEPHALELSLTLAAWQRLPSRAFDVVDWVQIMSYDHPGPHSTFESARADTEKLLAAGAPVGKLVLGLPFYGRDPTERQRTLGYRDILARFSPEPHIHEIDNLFFNGPELIRRKTEFALEAGLAGVMFWELGQDASGADSLLGVIRSTVSAGAPRR
jgi:GH18 family chitinase